MTTLFIILSFVLSIVGIIGCIIPGLPGHPLNLIAMICAQQWAIHPFSTITLIIFGVLTVLFLILDYFIPVWIAKKYGATRQGIIGSMIGMIVGIFFTPIGMIMGIIAGAIIGDMIAGRNTSDATKSGVATFFGTLLAIGLKLTLSGIMTAMVGYKLIENLII